MRKHSIMCEKLMINVSKHFIISGHKNSLINMSSNGNLTLNGIRSIPLL